ncbi:MULTISPECIES: hypothetical protein [Sphingobacterium]|uniref:Lipocalin-like domain-containing protein n=1 Tax=Sphingobacterium populi TaxID=1812824 RepID=A0ABW5UD89_9SPHI|nr:hypothetical protein [Sphingobacterium sp. CFCC 11742]
MLRLNRDSLYKLNYLLVGMLLIASLLVVIHVASPEKMIVGEWKEAGWYFEKPDYRLKERNFAQVLEQNVRIEILDKLEILHVNRWIFKEDGTLEVDDTSVANMTWSIKGRGHILEISRNGTPIESFQIQTLDNDQMELHLNLDIQIKGVIKILLKRDDLVN